MEGGGQGKTAGPSTPQLQHRAAFVLSLCVCFHWGKKVLLLLQNVEGVGLAQFLTCGS